MQVRILSKLSGALFIAFLAIGCSRPPAEIRPFMGPFNEETRLRFRALPPERQLEVFLEVRKYSRPRNYYVAAETASQNTSQTLDAALSRLKREQDEWTEIQIIDLVHVICGAKHICTDREMIPLITSKVQSMNSVVYKEEGTRILDTIRRSSETP